MQLENLICHSWQRAATFDTEAMRPGQGIIIIIWSGTWTYWIWWLRNFFGDTKMSLCLRKAGHMLWSSGKRLLAMASNLILSFGDTQYHTWSFNLRCSAEVQYCMLANSTRCLRLQHTMAHWLLHSRPNKCFPSRQGAQFEVWKWRTLITSPLALQSASSWHYKDLHLRHASWRRTSTWI